MIILHISTMDRSNFIIIVFIATLLIKSNGLHLKGTWHSRNFYFFLAKFGFQQTNMNDLTNTHGYIYGNITSKDSNVTNSMTLVVTDSEYFLEFYGNRTVMPRTKACNMMFSKLDNIAWDQTCNEGGKEDFLRRIPCPRDDYCVDEDNLDAIMPGGNQFTYVIRDTSQPR